MSDQTIKELYKASGGPWGGNVVDTNFIKWLTRIYGNGVMQRFKSEKMVDYFDLLRNFETKKRTLSSESEGKISFRCYKSLEMFYEEMEKSSLADRLTALELSDVVTWKDEELCIDASIVKSWFDDPVTNMIDHVLHILSRQDMQRVENILLVGGFGESKFVQDEMKRRIQNKKITIPNDPSLAVLKGAVRLGHLPSLVSARVVKVRSKTDVENM